MVELEKIAGLAETFQNALSKHFSRERVLYFGYESFKSA
jgi:hypothetical protein